MFQDDMYESIPDVDYSRKTCIPQETIITNVRLASAMFLFKKCAVIFHQ
ncbi:hypothetical protein [Clostridium sp. DMHC 10]|nr:hypothetical protein [Clostridium sp. DMHC 10]